MAEPGNQEHLKAQRKIAREYRKLGYKVVETPGREEIPGFLSGFTPDLIATKEDDRVAIEIKRADMLRGSNELTELATKVAEIPGWRFELHALEAPRAIEDQAPSEIALNRLIETAGKVFQTDVEGGREVALIALTAGLERLLKLIAVERGIDATDQTVSSLIRELSFQGVIDELTVSVLDSAIAWRDLAWHGDARGQGPNREDLQKIGDVCRRLLSNLIEFWNLGSVARQEVGYTASAVSQLPDNKPALYAIQTANGRIDYIGLATQGHVRERIRQHMSGKSGRISGAKVTLLQFDTIEEARNAEAITIQEFSPRHNRRRADNGPMSEPVKESCVRGRFHLMPLLDAEPVAEHNGELGHGSGPLALSILPLSADTAQGKVQ